MVQKLNALLCLFIILFTHCSKSSSGNNVPPLPTPPFYFSIKAIAVDGISAGNDYINTSVSPSIRLTFYEPLKNTSVTSAIAFNEKGGNAIAFSTSFQNSDSTLLVIPTVPLKYLTRYTITLSTALKSKTDGSLQNNATLNLFTQINPVNKFPEISDDALLDLVQKQTFKYFWEFGHPVSGLARERNTSGDIVTSGGSGFGIMTIVVAVNRHFISRAEGLARMQKIVSFLKNNAQKFKGAFSHWLNGATGAAVPFSAQDDGADLVETSYLMQGLLTARQYFSRNDATETALRNDINVLWKGVEWNWFRKGSENVLYWHWSPNYNWEMNHPVKGWNECLITYVLAASSPDYSIPKIVYDAGWASNGNFKNGNNYYGFQLPLGPATGGPLFFAHYSFLGINPKELTDAYANYWMQNTAHTLINYNYCKGNPKNYFGYSDSCWGLTASDNQAGYAAHEPNNDLGVISPTAALSSFPYTPIESMKALKYFYYRLGDKAWGEYGFTDAFNLTIPWFANSYLAIDQGPIIIMIENYRSRLLWNLFMSSPEVKTGMRNLGFQSPNL